MKTSTTGEGIPGLQSGEDVKEHTATAPSARQRLASVLLAAEQSISWGDAGPEDRARYLTVADTVLAAGFAETRVLHTAGELDALWLGSIVLTYDGLAWQSNAARNGTSFWSNTEDGDEEARSSAQLLRVNEGLPLTLVRNPAG